ncbi:cyanophycinase [Gramella lutea]|uniref:Cyanophycinase n=1 Tax=Christiangramia lutea TaxID=1607951 RepID=A0A9X1V4I5_9FLAO|nr:cyanophycinase [Christiangramia lutea]MCH4822659.1 cyanophycinase [Christiangramia lutea]
MKLVKITGLFLLALCWISCNSGDKSEKILEDEQQMAKVSNLPKGKLFIIGGGKRPPELVQELIEVSNLKNDTYAVILPMASVEPDSAVFYASKQFTELGIESEKIKGFNFQKNRQNVEQLDSLANAGLIYISGGDQNRFMDIVLNSPISDAIKRAYQNGATIAGTSAGAAVMSKKMITGDEFKHPEYTGDFKTIEAENIELKEGLGLIDNAIIDQHFIQRMRMNRLISTAIENPDEICIGIDESTAILVQNDSAKVLGAAQVIVLKNINKSKISKDGLIGGRDLQLSVILPGEKFAL